MSSRALAVAAASVVAVGAVVLTGLPSTQAAFTDKATVDAGPQATSPSAFTSGTLATPDAPSATPGTTSITVTWSPTTVNAGPVSGTADSYTVIRYPSATSSTGTPICANTAAQTCTDTTNPTGTVFYAVQARVGDQWVREGGRTSAALLTVSAPGDVRCTPSGFNLGAAITWSAPSGGADSYVVYWSRGTTTGTAPVAGTQWRPADLGNGVYTVRVAAVRAGVTSAAQASSGSITKSAGLVYSC